MGSFCKKEDCPTSEELLSLQHEGDRKFDAAELRYHLSVCDFCAAELDFYRWCEPVEENVDAGQMPRPLFELAEAILRRGSDPTPLYKLIDHSN
jgi:hypothetical protein